MFPYFPDSHNPNTILVHQKDIIRRELTEFLAIFLTTTYRCKALLYQ
jgi:hypothetical protein